MYTVHAVGYPLTELFATALMVLVLKSGLMSKSKLVNVPTAVVPVGTAAAFPAGLNLTCSLSGTVLNLRVENSRIAGFERPIVGVINQVLIPPEALLAIL